MMIITVLVALVCLCVVFKEHDAKASFQAKEDYEAIKKTNADRELKLINEYYTMGGYTMEQAIVVGKAQMEREGFVACIPYDVFRKKMVWDRKIDPVTIQPVMHEEISTCMPSDRYDSFLVKHRKDMRKNYDMYQSDLYSNWPKNRQELLLEYKMDKEIRNSRANRK